MTHVTLSSSSTKDSEKVKLKREKYAHLARVGHQKRRALAFQDAEEFYFTIATEQVALLREQLEEALELEKQMKAPSPAVAKATSRLTHLTRRLLHFWPRNSESQQRISLLLDSAGLATMMAVTDEGYLTLSSDQILGNVERIIALTKERNQKV